MTISLRQTAVGIVALAGALGPLACGSDSVNSNGSLKNDQSLLKEGACFGEALGGPTSCKPADTWRSYAEQACESRGLALTDLTLGAECKEGFSDLKYSCCKPGPKPIPPGPNPGPQCFADGQGGPTSCKPAEVWTAYANDLCLARGSKISHIDFAEECDKGAFRWTKYECCDDSGPMPPPPPAPVCEASVLGDPTSCKPDATWKEAALDHCARSGQVLADLALDAPCAPGSSQLAKVLCCGATPEPAPPPKPGPEPVPPKPEPSPVPPSSCVADYARADVCTDPDTWKRKVTESCAKLGLVVGDVSLGAPCPGGSTEAKFTCCK